MAPTGHARLGRTPSGLCQPQTWRNPQPETAKVGGGQRGLPPHTNSPLPTEGMWSPNWSQDWEGGRGGPHARRRKPGTSRVRSFTIAPGERHPAHRPLPALVKRSRGAHGAQTEEATRRRRGQREKEGHSPASAPSPYSTGSSHRPVARVRKRGDVQPH